MVWEQFVWLVWFYFATRLPQWVQRGFLSDFPRVFFRSPIIFSCPMQLVWILRVIWTFMWWSSRLFWGRSLQHTGLKMMMGNRPILVLSEYIFRPRTFFTFMSVLIKFMFVLFRSEHKTRIGAKSAAWKYQCRKGRSCFCCDQLNVVCCGMSVWSIDWLIALCWLVTPSVYRSIDWLIDWLIDWFGVWLISRYSLFSIIFLFILCYSKKWIEESPIFSVDLPFK